MSQKEEIEIYKNAFKDCFTTLLNENIKHKPMARKCIKKHADLMIKLRKQKVLDDTIPENRNNLEMFKPIFDVIDQLKESWLE